MSKEEVRVVITVNDDAIERLGQVTADLEHAGVEISHVLEFTGTVVGTYRGKGKHGDLKRVSGVASVELEGRQGTTD